MESAEHHRQREAIGTLVLCRELALLEPLCSELEGAERSASVSCKLAWEQIEEERAATAAARREAAEWLAAAQAAQAASASAHVCAGAAVEEARLAREDAARLSAQVEGMSARGAPSSSQHLGSARGGIGSARGPGSARGAGGVGGITHAPTSAPPSSRLSGGGALHGGAPPTVPALAVPGVTRAPLSPAAGFARGRAGRRAGDGGGEDGRGGQAGRGVGARADE